MIKLGVIGFGVRLTHMVKNCMRAADKDLRVVAAIDPDEAKVRKELPEEEAKALRFYSSVEEMIEKSKLDAIAIGTRCDLHSEYAIQASRNGLPIFLEKPVATTMEQAIELEEAFRISKSEVVVSFPLRCAPLGRRVAEQLQSGSIGQPEHVMAYNYVPYGDVYFNSWYRDYAVTGGLFLQKATHDFDFLRYSMGCPIVRIAAMKSEGRVYKDLSLKPDNERKENHAYYENIGTPESGMNEDSSSALLEFANGSKGLYTQVFYTRKQAAARGAVFSGYRGTLKFDFYQNQATLHHHYKPFVDEIKVDSDLSHHGGDETLAQNFIDVIREGRPSISTIWNGIESVYACLAAKESCRTNTFQDVRQIANQPEKPLFNLPV